MQAAQITAYGDASTINITEVPAPSLGDNQVLIQVHATSLNPVDSMVRNGYMHQMRPLTFPATLGGDVAGVITAVAPDVTTFAVGNAVYGQASLLSGGSGSLAEVAAVPVTTISAKPATLDFAHAAAAPLTGVSALQALTEHANLQAGQNVLILGAAGGIGTVAIQLAKHLGAQVTAVVRGSEAATYVHDLGADVIIDTAAGNSLPTVPHFEVVLDLTGGELAQAAFSALQPGGAFVSLAGAASDELATTHKVTAINQMTQVTAERLSKLATLLDAGAVTISIEKTFPLGQVQAAFTYREQEHVKGKVVITI